MERLTRTTFGMIGGGGGIRTHGEISLTMVFETTTIDRSVTPPQSFHFQTRHLTQLLTKLYSFVFTCSGRSLMSTHF